MGMCWIMCGLHAVKMCALATAERFHFFKIAITGVSKHASVSLCVPTSGSCLCTGDLLQVTHSSLFGFMET